MKVKITGIIIFGLIVCVLGIYAISNVDTNHVGVENFQPLHDAPQSHYENVLASPPLPDQIDFCGEPIPLHLYWVKEGLDRELIIHCYQHSRTLLTFKRSTRFFPVIEKILKEENVPDDMKYLCVAESNLENVVSPAKASGFWQFMEATGKHYGLEINEHVDERYHLEKATRAACKYLKKLNKQFGSWSLAMAAYNMGEAGLSKNMQEQQINNYWDLHLNQETSRYVNRCVSYKLMFENQELYNIRIAANEFYKPIDYKEIIIDKTIGDLREYCTENNILYRQLKELNPWLRSTRLPVHGNKTYILRVPK
ncbi:MAG: lytic transglycosylase domain-containing protein [Bacteroidetes bacterium]|nr:lytic transglycosylase domain-containing protein [Bacteroidota bacterium]MCL2301809.1 lytic transglycosylase domain-containing protein [Lentimicrobiaceae bacterium]